MNKQRKKFSAVIAVALVISLMMVLSSTLAVATREGVLAATLENTSIHEKIDISEITGEIPEPPMLTSAASSLAAEKFKNWM